LTASWSEEEEEEEEEAAIGFKQHIFKFEGKGNEVCR